MKIDPEDTPCASERKGDADVMGAFARWQQASVAAEALPDSATDAERLNHSAAIAEAEADLARPADTLTGVEAKLLHAFATLVESPEAYNAVWTGAAPDPQGDALSDARHALLWSAIQDLRRIKARAD